MSKESDTGEQRWFYKMYTSDPALRGQVTWVKDGNALSCSMKTLSGFTLNSRASLEPDGVAITHEIARASFSGVFLERTYVHHPERLELIASDTPDRLQKNAEEWLPCRYIARVGKNAPPAEYRVERLDGVTRPQRPARPSSPRNRSGPDGRPLPTPSIAIPSSQTPPALVNMPIPWRLQARTAW